MPDHRKNIPNIKILKQTPKVIHCIKSCLKRANRASLVTALALFAFHFLAARFSKHQVLYLHKWLLL